MRVLLIGVGTVGEAIARISASADWCEAMILADYDVNRARTLADSLGDPTLKATALFLSMKEKRLPCSKSSGGL